MVGAVRPGELETAHWVHGVGADSSQVTLTEAGSSPLGSRSRGPGVLHALEPRRPDATMTGSLADLSGTREYRTGRPNTRQPIDLSIISFKSMLARSPPEHHKERPGVCRGAKFKGSRPVSRVLSGTVIHLGRASPRASSGLPGCDAGHTDAPLFGLAPGGVCRAAACCHPRGALLPHHFTLACARRPSAVCFLWHFPSARAAQALPGTLPCGARTFLDGASTVATVRPTPGG